MLLRMRTTINISDALFAAAKARAVRDRKPLRAIVEQALREFLSGSKRATAKGPPIPVCRGRGLQPGVDLADNSAIEDLMSAESRCQCLG